MATTVNVTSSYSGKAAMEILTPLFRGLEEFAGAVMVHNNVDFKMPIQRLKGTAAFKSPSQKFTPGGTVTVDERVLFPVPIEAQWEFSKLALRGAWYAESLKSAQGGRVPQRYLDAINKNIMGLSSEEFLRLLWVGTTAGSVDLLNGLFTQIKASSTVVKPTFTAVTANNVKAQMGLVVYDAGADKFRQFGKTILYVSSDVASFYAQSIPTEGNGIASNQQIAMNFHGFPIKVVSWLPAGTIIFANGMDNFHIGFNEGDASNSLNVIDAEFTTGDKELRISAGFSLDVKLGFDEEIVAHYNPA
jgi:hypothetical protein